jgi:hypothetical protein
VTPEQPASAPAAKPHKILEALANDIDCCPACLAPPVST